MGRGPVDPRIDNARNAVGFAGGQRLPSLRRRPPLPRKRDREQTEFAAGCQGGIGALLAGICGMGGTGTKLGARGWIAITGWVPNQGGSGGESLPACRRREANGRSSFARLSASPAVPDL